MATPHNQQREVEQCLDELLIRTVEVKNHIANLLHKVESMGHSGRTPIVAPGAQAPLDSWPSMLDSFSVISGQLNLLWSGVRHGGPGSSDELSSHRLLSTLTLFPILLSPDPDQALVQATENRVPAFNHEVAPLYLRTKLEPTVEEKEQVDKKEAGDPSRPMADTNRPFGDSNRPFGGSVTERIKTRNEAVARAVSTLQKASEEIDWSHSKDYQQTAFTYPLETEKLVAAITVGKGLKSGPPMSAPSPSSPAHVSPRVRGGRTR